MSGPQSCRLQLKAKIYTRTHTLQMQSDGVASANSTLRRYVTARGGASQSSRGPGINMVLRCTWTGRKLLYLETLLSLTAWGQKRSFCLQLSGIACKV